MNGSARGEELFQHWLDAREQGSVPDVTTWLADESEGTAHELREKIANFEALYQHLQGPPGGIAPGSQLGPYLLIKKLGTGGMGEVWQATEVPLSRDVAVKLLPPLFGLSPQARLRFARETRAASRVEHPNVLRVYAAGEVEGVPFLATELVAGGRTLEHWIADLHRDAAPGRSEYHRVAEMFASIAEGLAAVHARGILHRDLKPSNVLVTPEGTPKLADFGMARFEGAATVTVTGGQIGTPRYMAPELIRDARAASPLSDLFSFGATLYEALTGLPAFEGDAREQVAHAILSRDPIHPRLRRSHVPPELEVLCLRCLEKVSGLRPESAFFLAEELRRFLHGEPIRCRPPGAFERLSKAARRNPWRAAACVALVAGLLVSAWSLQQLAGRNQVLEDALAETGTVSNLLQPAGFGPSRKGARESLFRQKARLDSLSLSPERRARVLADLGRGMVFMEEYHDALKWLEEAMRLGQQENLPRDFQAEVELFAGWAIGRSTRSQEEFARAESWLRGVIDDPGGDLASSIRRDWARNRLGQVLLERGAHMNLQAMTPEEHDLARVIYEQAGAVWIPLEAELRTSHDAQRIEILALTLLDLAVLHGSLDPTPEKRLLSIDYCQQAREFYLGSFGPEHPELAYVDLAEAMALRGLDRTAEAVELMRRSRGRVVRLYGPGSPMEFEIGITLIDCLFQTGGREAARACYEELLAQLDQGTRPFRAEGENWQEGERKRLEGVWAGLSGK